MTDALADIGSLRITLPGDVVRPSSDDGLGMTTHEDSRLRACLDLRWRPGGETVREHLERTAREAYDATKEAKMPVRRPLLRGPGEPRHDEPRIPGFGICNHPEHGTVVWIVEGEIIDGKAIGRCVRHHPRIDEIAADMAAAYSISLEDARARVLGGVGL